MPEIRFLPDYIAVQAATGETILEAARRAQLLIESPCDGNGTCGKCKVRVSQGLAEGALQSNETTKITAQEAEQGYVLACQTAVTGDITVETVSTEAQNKSLKILSEGQSFAYEIINYMTKSFADGQTTVYAGGAPIGTEAGDTTGQNYGLAIDIGTTTLVCALIDALSGEELVSVSALNPQSLHAQDVLTRIKFASNEEGLATMYDGMCSQLREMITDVCRQTGVDRHTIYEAVYSGNTTMITLATREDPVSLGRYP
ncbi:MAG: 2Fe-2S iron-sulfur cluster binding domain-containing protein, partial [Peptococcaceae bacterium]|nr:2Fe-2S iron-sulfur cluster binding domain-containing protein [Peptococcaceae bacterium]